MVDHEMPWRINEQDITLFAACNGGFYGGKYNIAPHADLTDGLLDIYYVDTISKLKIYSLMSVLERGEHENYPEFIHHFRTNDLTIESDTPLIGNFDGQVKKSRIWHIEDCHQELLISTPEFKVLKKVA
jgi:diacylglycerol kinase family enzyme